jgi:2-octaprenyl-6-methoxyphenol hydroxylase
MERSDVIILGGGLVGLTLAIALDAHGLTTTVIDPADPETQLATGFDGRASAIASASWRMLQTIGVGALLEGQGCEIRRIEVRDGLSPESLKFDADDHDDPLGIMFENRAVRAALRQRALAAENITLLAPARPIDVVRDAHGVRVTRSDGRTVTGSLLVGAEGRRSPTREATGIRIAQWKYDHVAMIASITHEKPHGNIAHEIFYPDGPFALLPMLPGNRCCMVWTVAAADAPAYLDLPERAYAAEVSKRLGGMLGEVALASPRSSYPLGFHHAATITAERLALVGDAAHGIHPIAGQGLNLGLRDVAALAEVLVDGARLGLDAGDAQLLARYQCWRSLDSLMVAASTDTFTRLFGIPGRPARAIRRFGLAAVEKIRPLKSYFMAEARGEAGDMPRLLKGMEV